ncbi:hypothetical protein OG21DRAFT_1527598 [Imleria badia]|nr:hypothetical protein OG21DRAFT_1527598 [Imleria badia]
MSGNLGTRASSQSTAASTNTFSFAAPKPTAGSGPAGGTSAAGTSGICVFGSSAPSADSVFGGGSSPHGQPKPETIFGATPAKSTDANPPPVATGTSIPTFAFVREKDPSDTGITFHYQSITAAPAFKGASLENCKTVGASTHMSSGSPAVQRTSLLGIPTVTQQPTAGSIFGGRMAAAFGTTTSRPAMDQFGPIWNQQSTTDSGTASSTLEKPQPQQPAAGTGTSYSSADPILDPKKLEHIEELLRKSLLGEEVVNTQFHLFSGRSSPLAKSSKYFLDLLSADINTSDPSLMDLTGDNDIPSSAPMHDYGYESDSDLDDCDEPVLEASKDQSPASPVTPPELIPETQRKDGNE